MKKKDLDNNILLVLSTERNLKNAKQLAKKILNKKLAACVTFTKVNSTYWWEDELEYVSEIQMMIKTKIELEKQILEFIRKNHSYSLPELICLKGVVVEKYSRWIHETVQ